MANLIRRGRNLMEGKDNYDLNVVTSIQKAINKEDNPTKIKHVRSIIISTHHERGASTFWSQSMKMAVQSQGPLCWKFCHVLHKLMREGHDNVRFDSMKYLTWLDDLSRVWGHLPENFGPLNAHYLKMITNRLKFHKKHIKIPGNLDISDEMLAEITGHDANGYFEFSVELLDLMDDELNLQAQVFHQLERSYDNSMTQTGQCKLYPLILVIQDSCQLYDLLVKMLFKLHKVVPADALSGHRERFIGQYKSAKHFYYTCGNLQYYRNLVQVPVLPDSPPNFLIASEIFKHKKPVAIVAGEEPDDEPERPPPPPPEPVRPLVETKPTPPPEPTPDARDTVISQLRTQVQHLTNELEFVKTKARERIAELNSQIETLKKQLEKEVQSNQDTQASMLALKRKLEESQREQDELKEKLSAAEANVAAAATLSKAEEHAKSSDERYKKMREVYEKLKQEHVDLLRGNAAIKKQATAERQAKEELRTTFNDLKDELVTVKSEQSVLQESMQKSSDEASKHTASLENRIDELDKQKAEFEGKLIETENENRLLQSKLSDYESTAAELKQDLMKQQEGHQMSASTMNEELNTTKEQLSDAQAKISDKTKEAEELQSQLEAVKSEKTSQLDELGQKISSLEASLAQLGTERDQALHNQSELQIKLEKEIAELKQQMDKEAKELEYRKAYNTLTQAIEKGVAEVNYTLDFIGSDEFVSHTCNADAAVSDLRKLDDELSLMSKSIDESDDLLELSHLVHNFTHRVCRTMEESKAACNRAPPEQGDELAERCNQLGNNSVELMGKIKDEYQDRNPNKAELQAKLQAVRDGANAMLDVARGLLIRGDDININEIGELVDEELNATQKAIEEGADKIQAMLEKSRLRDSGIKLEVNEKILDAVTRLMQEIQQLVRKSKDLQAEIVASGRGSASAKEFYMKNHRWTEGLVSAAKAVGWGASTLVEKAERIIEGKGTLNELKVCSHEIAASTAQLVVSSQVKADKGSKKLSDLKSSAKGVKTATADVVASSKFGEQMIEEADLMDFNNLTLTQTKRVEMNTQVHILELESNLEKERKKLAQIRQRHYQLAGESEGWELDEDGNLIDIYDVDELGTERDDETNES